MRSPHRFCMKVWNDTFKLEKFFDLSGRSFGLGYLIGFGYTY